MGTEKYCQTCKKEIDSLFPFRCKRCKQYFCEDHRLPEQHNCSYIKTSWDIWRGRQKMLQGIPIERHAPRILIKSKEETSKPEKIFIDTKKKNDDTLFKKCSFCSTDSFNLSQCQYCKEWFCRDHIKPKKPEEIDYLRTPGGHLCKPFAEKEKEQEVIVREKEKNKPFKGITKPLYRHPNHMIRWFFWKKHPHSRLRKKDFIIQIVSIIILLLLFWLAYSYSGSSRVIFWVLNLTAIFETCLIILIIYFTYKFLVNLRFGIRGLANGFKIIAAVIVLLFCTQIFLQPGVITEPIAQFNYATLNPLAIDLIDQNNGGTNNNYNNYGDSSNTNDNNDIVIPLPNSKPIINIAELESEIHLLINNERQKNGIPALQYDVALSDIARSHSRDMATRNYFSHDNPEGDGPTERAIKASYNVHKELGGGWYSDGIAENIFQNNLYDSVTYYNGIPVYDWNSQSEIAFATVNGWMNSPGHRQNILNSGYDKEGIGIAISSDDKVYITEDFW